MHIYRSKTFLIQGSPGAQNLWNKYLTNYVEQLHKKKMVPGSLRTRHDKVTFSHLWLGLLDWQKEKKNHKA